MVVLMSLVDAVFVRGRQYSGNMSGVATAINYGDYVDGDEV